MKTTKELTDEQVIQKEFMRRFSMWDIPVEKLQISLDKMPNEVKQGHYIEIKDILAKDAFKRELSDWLRRVSFTLSIGIWNGVKLTDIQSEALRIVMLEIKNFEETLEKRSMLAIPPRPLRSPSDKI